MRPGKSVILFPGAPEFFPPPNHSLYTGGIDMKVTHQHPKYNSEKERLNRLRELKKACTIKIHGLHSGARTA